MEKFNENIDKTLNNIVNSNDLLKMFCYLNSRWEDEKKYENFTDYKNKITETFNNLFEITPDKILQNSKKINGTTVHLPTFITISNVKFVMGLKIIRNRANLIIFQN